MRKNNIKHPFLILFLILINCSISTAQKRDSLLSQLDTTQNLKKKVDLLLHLSDLYLFSTDRSVFDLALPYDQRALETSRETDSDSLVVKCLIRVGSIKMVEQEFEESLTYFIEAAEISTKAQNKLWMIESIYRVGGMYRILKDFPNALKYLSQSYDLACELNDNRLIAMAVTETGKVLQMTNRFKEALDLYGEGLLICKNSEIPTGIQQINGSFEWWVENIPLNKLEITVDSIDQVYQSPDAFNRLSEYVRKKDPLLAIKFGEKALNLSQNAFVPKEQATAYQNIGYPYYRQNQDLKAEPYFKKSLALSQEIKDTLLIIQAKLYLGSIYSNLYQIDKGETFLNDALNLSIRFKNVDLESDCINQLASIYEKKGEYGKALDYLKKTLTENQNQKDSTALFQTLFNIAHNYKKQGFFKKSLAIFWDYYYYELEKGNKENLGLPLLNIGDVYAQMGVYDTAAIYLHQSIEYSQKYKQHADEGDALSKLSQIHFENKEHGKSIEYIERAIKVYEENGVTNRKINAFKSKSELYLKLGKMEEAIDLVNRGLKLSIDNEILESQPSLYQQLGRIYQDLGEGFNAKKAFAEALLVAEKISSNTAICDIFLDLSRLEASLNQHNRSINYAKKSLQKAQAINYYRIIKPIYSLLIENYRKIGDFKEAFRYQDLNKNLEDSLFNLKKVKQLSELEFKFLEKEKILENKLLKAEAKEKETLLQRRTILLFGMGIVLVLILFIGILYNQKSKIAAEYKLRKKLTHDIHDDIGGILNNLKRTAKIALEKRADNHSIEKELQQTVRLGEEALVSFKRIIWTLETEEKKLEEYKSLIQEYTEKNFNFYASPYSIQFLGFDIDKKLSSKVQHHLFMIYKEALQNIIKHTESELVDIHWSYHANNLTMSVKNKYSKKINGNGTDKGISIMKKRAKLIDGKIEFQKGDKDFLVRFEGGV